MACESDSEKYVLHGPPKEFKVHPKGLGWDLFESMLRNKDKTGQQCSQSGVQETHGDVLRRAIKTSLELRRRGLTSDDVVSICCFNSLNSTVPVLASLFLNCKVACLDPTLSVEDTRHLVNQTKPKIIFIGEEAEQLMSKVFDGSLLDTEIITFGRNSRYERFVNFLVDHPDEDSFQPVPARDLRETIVIFFSSGTTGLAKGICSSHYALMCQMDSGKKVMGETTTLMSFASNYWMSTLFIIYACISQGAKRLLVPYFNPKEAWEAIHVFKPNFMFAAPCQLLQMIKDGVPEGKETKSLDLITTGGHFISPHQLKQIRDHFPNTNVLQGYGMTEVGLLTSFVGVDHGDPILEQKIASCGTLASGLTAKVVDLETEESCGPNQNGELRLKADFLMSGYYGLDSSSAWDENGWLKTGDVVYYDEDFYFYHVERSKEMFKYKSWHIVPAKLEAVLSEHPDVVNVVVVGVPHDFDGEHPCGVVTLKGGSKVTAEDIRNFANSQLDDRHQLRGGVWIFKDLPTTPSGKIKRREVLQRIVNECY